MQQLYCAPKIARQRNETMTTTNSGFTPTWVPKGRADIAGKEHNYRTARYKHDGSFVRLVAFMPEPDQFLIERAGLDQRAVDWTELDSFVL